MRLWSSPILYNFAWHFFCRNFAENIENILTLKSGREEEVKEDDGEEDEDDDKDGRISKAWSY